MILPSVHLVSHWVRDGLATPPPFKAPPELRGQRPRNRPS